MDIVLSILLYLLFLVLGFGIQFFIRWSPWLNMALSFGFIILLPPSLNLGLITGSWISCAFFTYNPEPDRPFDSMPAISFRKTILASLWTFCGFLLTLIFIWKLKASKMLDFSQREVLAWIFLTIVEVCLYRVIARVSPSLYRIPLGYGIAVINFIMILYWIYPLGISWMLLVLFSLLIISPLLLWLVDRPINAVQDSIFRRK